MSPFEFLIPGAARRHKRLTPISLKLVDRDGGREVDGVGGQLGSPGPGRAAGGEAQAEAISSHDRARSNPPEEVAKEGVVTIFVAFSNEPLFSPQSFA